MDIEIMATGGLEAYLKARTEVGPGEDDCWLWTLKPDSHGYGMARFNKQRSAAHRLSYTHYVGPIPDGYELDHTCVRPICVNPAHLEPVTGFENLVRKYTRKGYSREYAEQLVRTDEALWKREREFRAATKQARETAAAAGAGVGAHVRRGARSKGAIWVAKGAQPSERGGVWLKLESLNSGRPDGALLDSVTPVTD